MPDLELVTVDRTDVQRIVSWVTSQADVVTFAGPSLLYPFTAEAFFESAAGRWESCALRSGPVAVATGALEDRGSGEVRLGRVLVDPARRGNGLGRRLMESLMDRAAAHSEATFLTLSVFDENHAARALYESLGFAHTGVGASVLVGQETWTVLELKLDL